MKLFEEKLAQYVMNMSAIMEKLKSLSDKIPLVDKFKGLDKKKKIVVVAGITGVAAAIFLALKNRS